MMEKNLVGGREENYKPGLKMTTAYLNGDELSLQLVREMGKTGLLDYRPLTGELFLDPGGRKLWGLQPDSHLDLNVFLSCIHQDDRPRVQAAFGSVLNSDRQDRLEIRYRVRPLDGSPERWAFTAGGPIIEVVADQVRSIRLICIIEDITENKRLEDKLRLVEEKYGDLVKYAPIGIYEFDLQGPRFRNVNDVMCQYLGYTREELLAKNPLDLLDDRCKAIVRDRIKNRLAGVTIDNSVEMKVIAKDGRVYFAILYIILTYKDGNPDGAIVIAHDVTERKQAESIIKEHESRAEILLEITRAFASAGFNSKSLLEVISRRTAEVLGDTCDIALISEDGKWLKSMAFYHINPVPGKIDLEKFMGTPCRVGDGIAGKVAEKGSPKRIPVIKPERVKAGGADAYESLADACPVHSVLVIPLAARGQVIGTIAAYRHSQGRPYTKRDQALLQDIADRAALSLENALLFERMEQEISERKRAEMELTSAKEQAELYLDLMGHDINNMHTVALGYLELVRDMPAHGHRKDFIEKSMEMLNRSSQLIENVMKLQALKEGLLQTGRVDVCRVIHEVQAEYGVSPGKVIRLNLNGIGHCYVQANDLLYDVFSNLVSNAIKHTGIGTDISIFLEAIEVKGKTYCLVAVEDEGPGVPDELKRAIFNRKTRGNTTAKGMGLGLYLVKSLVESMGGRAWVEDRFAGDHSKGARFMVLLPVAQEQDILY